MIARNDCWQDPRARKGFERFTFGEGILLSKVDHGVERSEPESTLQAFDQRSKVRHRGFDFVQTFGLEANPVKAMGQLQSFRKL